MVEPLFKLDFPQVKDVEVVLVRLADGRLVARTKEELELADAGDERKEGA